MNNLNRLDTRKSYEQAKRQVKQICGKKTNLFINENKLLDIEDCVINPSVIFTRKWREIKLYGLGTHVSIKLKKNH